MAWLETETGTYAGSGSAIHAEQGATLTPTAGVVTVTDSFHRLAAGTLSTINGGVANALYVLLAVGTVTISAATNITTASTSILNGQLLVLWFDGTTYTDLGSSGMRLTGRETVAGHKTFTDGVFERGRTLAMGEWSSFTPVVTASSGTCTFNSAAAQWTVIGKTMVVTVATGTVSVSATPNSISIAIPGGFASSANSGAALAYSDNGTIGTGFARVNGSTTIDLFKNVTGTGSWATSASASQFAFTLVFGIA